MKARCYCKKHGKLKLDQIIIKNGVPVCGKCYSELEFCNVRPRFKANGGKTKS